MYVFVSFGVVWYGVVVHSDAIQNPLFTFLSDFLIFSI